MLDGAEIGFGEVVVQFDVVVVARSDFGREDGFCHLI